MNIAIIMCGPAVEPGGGVRLQGIMWCNGLRKLGHKVDLISFWDTYNWTSYDSIIILQFVGCFRGIVGQLSKINPNLVVAPILDPNPLNSKVKIKLMSKYFKVFERINLTSDYRKLYDASQKCKLILARSKYEADYLNQCFDIPSERIKIVPLSLRFKPADEIPQKENFCLHVSRLSSPNKNVARLILASQKYGFKLKLAGALNGEIEKKWLCDLIGDNSNIEYLGEISDEQLINYYQRAKVFALPSLNEGVGMVALEAAGFGCEIVLTNLGAPKDYYDGRALLVSPYDVDELGTNVVRCIEKGYSQPNLLNYIKNNYTEEVCIKKLEEALSIFVS